MPKKSKRSFFQQFLKERKTVGSITPSSRYLSRRMISKIDFSQAQCIVELGPGTGVITREIIKRLGPDTQLLVFEMNEVFIERYLQYNDPRIHIIHDSAEHLRRYLEKLGLAEADYIVSSLPLTNFPEDLKHVILDESLSCLRAGGIFIQYQYLTTALKMMREKFPRVRLEYAPFNIPPAFIYACYNC
ncbi:MAG: rRNA adenine N-6-methyltransferase family protein [Bacteroidota bacterium]